MFCPCLSLISFFELLYWFLVRTARRSNPSTLSSPLLSSSSWSFSLSIWSTLWDLFCKHNTTLHSFAKKFMTEKDNNNLRQVFHIMDIGQRQQILHSLIFLVQVEKFKAWNEKTEGTKYSCFCQRDRNHPHQRWLLWRKHSCSWHHQRREGFARMSTWPTINRGSESRVGSKYHWQQLDHRQRQHHWQPRHHRQSPDHWHTLHHRHNLDITCFIFESQSTNSNSGINQIQNAKYQRYQRIIFYHY